MLTRSQASMYRKMTIGDDVLMSSLFAGAEGSPDALGVRTSAFVRLAALIASDAEPPAYQREVRDAINAGASSEEITAVLTALTRVVGSALVMSAAPKLAMALGYDVQAGFEDADTRDGDA